MEKFDAIVIGVGQAGNPLVNSLTENGLRVAVIEKRHPGGSCINYGCTPTKAMLASAAVAYEVQHANQWGIKAEQVRAQYKKVISRRDTIVKSWRKSIDKRISHNPQAELIYGEACFSGPREVTVSLQEGGTQSFTAPKIFINVGTNPRHPNVPGLDEVDCYSSRSIMKLKEKPEHLLILGGSYIGVEYAQMYRRLGCNVTLLHNQEQLLPREDPEVAAAVHQLLESEGISVRLMATTTQARQLDDGLCLTVELPGLGEKKVKGSHLLVAVGTSPATNSLNLDETGVKTDKHGYIKVNERLETSTPGIWALGDCKGGPEFTHISYDDYRVVINQLYGDGTRTTAGRPVPYTLYIRPELGRIGLTEKQAKDQGLNYKTVKIEANEVGRTTLEGYDKGLIKVLIDPDTNQILGGACLIERGGEMAAMLQIAMMGKLPYQSLRDGIFAHPSYSEAWNTLFAKVSG